MPLVGQIRTHGLLWTKNADQFSSYEVRAAAAKVNNKAGQTNVSFTLSTLFFEVELVCVLKGVEE